MTHAGLLTLLLGNGKRKSVYEGRMRLREQGWKKPCSRARCKLKEVGKTVTYLLTEFGAAGREIT